jgi:MFS family permease
MPTIARLSRRGTFWTSGVVLALCLWASGAPSVLYPSYAAEWHLSSVVVTTVFATYPVALLIVLLFFGGISDFTGRRRAMLIGVALIALAAAVFAIAPSVGFLYLGRVLQGVGTGFALGAASASLVENNVSRNPRFPSSLTATSTATGLTLALVVSGLLAQVAPLPLVLSYLVLLVIAVVAVVLIVLSADDRAARTATTWRPQPLHFPRGRLRAFIAATVSVAVAYSVGAIFLSLGAQMARQLTGTTNLIVIGALLGVSSFCIGGTALLLQRVPAHVAIAIGGGLSVLGLGVLAATAASGSIAMFLAWCIVGGVGYSFAFTGGLGLINRTAEPQHRGATLSLLYLFAYLLQAATAIGAGALATALGISRAIDIVAPLVGLLCVAALVLALVDLTSERRANTTLRPEVAAVTRRG